jgi:hypothetical protein
MQPQSQLGFFNYDVFISYKSEEESWAKRIAESLRGFGLKVWRDHDAGDGIRVSEKWSNSIENGIRSSKMMIVLWSKLVHDNYATSVVQEEIEQMNTLIKNDQTGQRKFITVLLDGTSVDNHPKLGSYQADVSFKDLYGQYGAKGAAQISPIEWYGTIKNLIEAIGIMDVVEIRFVVAAMNRTQAEELRDNPASCAKDLKMLNLMCEMMQKTSSSFDVQRYGDSSDDWQPYPQLANFSIKDIINLYDEQKRDDAISRKQYAKWILVSYSDKLLSKVYADRSEALTAIQKGPCLVIVDPLSLMHKEVFEYVITYASLHNQQEAFFIGVSPFFARRHKELLAWADDLDNQFRNNLLGPIYDLFEKPFIRDERACVLSVEHEWQFFRWLQVAADRIVLANRTPLSRRNVVVHPLMNKLIQSRAATKPQPNIIDMSGQSGGAG